MKDGQEFKYCFLFVLLLWMVQSRQSYKEDAAVTGSHATFKSCNMYKLGWLFLLCSVLMQYHTWLNTAHLAASAIGVNLYKAPRPEPPHFLKSKALRAFEPPPHFCQIQFIFCLLWSCLPQCNEQWNEIKWHSCHFHLNRAIKDASCEQNLFEFLALAFNCFEDRILYDWTVV